MNIHICVANQNIEGYLVIAIAAEVCPDRLTVLQPWSRNVERVRSKFQPKAWSSKPRKYPNYMKYGKFLKKYMKNEFN